VKRIYLLIAVVAVVGIIVTLLLPKTLSRKPEARKAFFEAWSAVYGSAVIDEMTAYLRHANCDVSKYVLKNGMLCFDCSDSYVCFDLAKSGRPEYMYSRNGFKAVARVMSLGISELLGCECGTNKCDCGVGELYVGDDGIARIYLSDGDELIRIVDGAYGGSCRLATYVNDAGQEVFSELACGDVAILISEGVAEIRYRGGMK